MNNLQQRLFASLIGIPFAAFAIIFSVHPVYKIVFAIALSLLAAFGLHELYAMQTAKGLKPSRKGSIFFSIALLFACVYKQDSFLLIECILLLYFLSLFLFYFRRGQDPLLNLSGTVFGFLYVTVPLAFFPFIANFTNEYEDGRVWLIYLLFVVKATDTGAFFFGKTFGKRPLAPIISPQKTWEGAFCGFLLALFVSVAFSFLSLNRDIGFTLSLEDSLLLGALLSITAQLGDLAESLLKRDAKIKNSSSLPGLGGFLDILDSLVFTTPLLYIWITNSSHLGVIR